ncbi:Ag1 [Aphelenchoides avenae]|nr:Ag1 [Aphelenchus avenae]KAH7705422.1 Ag1 [Aphelenchus avenae]
MVSYVHAFALVTFAVCVLADKDPTKAPPPPPFLEGEPESAVDEYKKILETGKDHPEEVDGNVEEWINKQSDKVQAKYKQFTQQQKAIHDEALALHKKVTEKYSPEAKEADAKILAIVDDKAIQREEKGEKIAEVLKSYPESVRKELGSFAKASNDAALKASSSDVKGGGSGKPAGAGWATSGNATEVSKEEQEANYIVVAFIGVRRRCGCYNNNYYNNYGYYNNNYGYNRGCGYYQGRYVCS